MRLWVSWERHRRSRELAAALGCELVELDARAPWAARVLVLSGRTAALLLRKRPRLLIVQNPSIVLATMACLLRPLLRYRLVVDRHSNFFEETLAAPSLKFRLFHFLSRYTVRRADLTIVTNAPLRELLESWGGRGFILPDKLPALTLAQPRRLEGERSVVFVCSHSFDEPLAEVLAAARLLGASFRVYVTGDSRLSDRKLVGTAPENVVFTGWLEEAAYQSLLASADVVLALTHLPNTLLCGAYEAVSLGQALVISDHEALTGYFGRAAVAAGSSPRALAAAIEKAVRERTRLRAATAALATELEADWKRRFVELRQAVGAV